MIKAHVLEIVSVFLLSMAFTDHQYVVFSLRAVVMMKEDIVIPFDEVKTLKFISVEYLTV